MKLMHDEVNIQKLQLEDGWTAHDFAKLLSDYNEHLGNEQFFSNLLKKAFIADKISAVSIYDSMSLDINNTLLSKSSLLTWALSKNFKIPPVLTAYSESDSTKQLGKIAEMNCEGALAIMAYLLSENKRALMISGRPNCEAIAKEVSVLAKKHFGEDVRGFTAFHKKLANALKTLEQ